MEPKYVPVAELATQVQMHRSTLHRWLQRHQIPIEKQHRREYRGQEVSVVSKKNADKVARLLTVAEGY